VVIGAVLWERVGGFFSHDSEKLLKFFRYLLQRVVGRQVYGRDISDEPGLGVRQNRVVKAQGEFLDCGFGAEVQAGGGAKSELR